MSIYVETLPGLDRQGRWRLRSLQARDAHCFYWITRGQGRISIRATSRGYAPNSVLFVPAGQVHALEMGMNTQGYAAFLPDSLPVPVPGSICFLKATSIFDQGQITGYFEQLSAEHTATGPGSDHVMESYLTLLSVWIERNRQRNDWQDESSKKAAARLASRFLDHLEQHFHKARSVSDFAASMGVTPTHLSRVCRQELGKPASDLIQDRLTLEARYLLADGSQKIADIAAALGFGSAAYFTRQFRQNAGQSPREFRKSARERPQRKRAVSGRNSSRR